MSDPVHPARRALLLASSLLALLTSCLGPGGSEGLSARITLRQSGDAGPAVFELRSESHTDRIDFYSTARDGASVKIMRDDLMAALLEGFEQAGYRNFAAPGKGPRDLAGGVRKVIEVERDGSVTHLSTALTSPPDRLGLMAELTLAFFGAYNSIKSYQTIESDDGTIFLGPGN
jgi:hypothetical protein